MSSFNQFLGEFFKNWFLYMTAGPFLFDELFGRLFPHARDKFNRKFPKQWRRKIEIAFLLIGVFYAGFAAFNEEHEKLEALRAAPQPASSPIQFEVHEHGVDTESRKEITELKSQLNAAKDTIRALQSQSDTLSAPIASGSCDIRIKLEQPGNGRSSMSGGPIVAVALVRAPLLSLNSEEAPELLFLATASAYQIDDNGDFRATANYQFDSRLVGKTIRSLKAANMLQIELPPDIRSNATGGQVAIAVNSSVLLTFKIPRPTENKELGSARGFQILDVRDALGVLDDKATQPSPTPNKEASPP